MASTIRIGDIKTEHHNKEVEIIGYIEKLSSINPELVLGSFECKRCGNVMEIKQPKDNNDKTQEPLLCDVCETNGPFSIIPEESEFTDYQKINIEENRYRLKSSDPNNKIEAILKGDLTDGSLSRGDRVRVVGMIRLIQRNVRSKKLSGFNYHIEAKSIEILKRVRN